MVRAYVWWPGGDLHFNWHCSFFFGLCAAEALQNSTDSLKQANNVLAEQVENAQSAEWLRHVNDKLRTNELKV